MNRLPPASTATSCGLVRYADVAAPPSPPCPPEPWPLPATVYTSPAVMAMPNWVWLDAATSWIRLLLASAMNTSLMASAATPDGVCSPAVAAGPPSPVVYRV